MAEACAKGEADNGRKGPLNLPNLTRLGLAKAHEGSTGFIPAGMDGNAEVIGAYAWAHEMSSGKDTPSGHWEIAGVPVLFEWGYFSDHENSFPQELLDKLVERANLPGYLGNCHSSGTVILDQLGEEHMKTGKPIFYTSADSVFQIACHEETFGLDKLYELCEIAREELTNGGYNIGRVIARPFIGDKAGNFQRTGNRHDSAVEPPAPTVLQKLVDEKHGRWFRSVKLQTSTPTAVSPKSESDWLDALFDATIKEMKEAGDNTIVFTNFVDFDSSGATVATSPVMLRVWNCSTAVCRS
ncbi:phosphopentomutase [Escherichia coli]|nr:phosphopentomutase [Escherichia coli]